MKIKYFEKTNYTIEKLRKFYVEYVCSVLFLIAVKYRKYEPKTAGFDARAARWEVSREMPHIYIYIYIYIYT